MIKEAAAFAARAHAGAMRKGSNIPYIYHPMEVALITAQMTEEETVIAAAYLHDVLEDTPVTPEELEAAFGAEVRALVEAETEDKTRSWQERKQTTIEHLREASRQVRILTLADKLSNMRSTARDYMVVGDEIWQRFNEKRKEKHQWYIRGIIGELKEMEAYPAYQELLGLYKFVYGA